MLRTKPYNNQEKAIFKYNKIYNNLTWAKDKTRYQKKF